MTKKKSSTMSTLRKTVRSFYMHMKTYLFLFLIFLVCSPVLLRFVQARILEGEAHSNESRVHSQAAEFSAYVQTIDSKLAQWISNSAVKTISCYSSDYALPDQFDFYLLLSELKTLMPSFTVNEQVILNDCLLYFPNAQLAFSPATMYKKSYLVSDYLQIETQAFDALIQAVLAASSPRGWFAIEGGTQRFFLYTRRMTLENKNQVVALYFFHPDAIRFGNDPKTLTYLAAANGQILSPQHTAAELPDYAALAGWQDGGEIRLNQEDYLCNAATSTHGDYRLVMLTPKSVFYARARTVTSSLALIFGSVMLCILLLAVGDYRWRRSKLNEVQKILVDTGDAALEPDMGYSVLKESISRLLEQNEQTRQQLAHYDTRLQNSRDMMRKSILKLVVTGRMNSALAREHLAEYGIVDAMEGYQVALVRLQLQAEDEEAEAHARHLVLSVLDAMLPPPDETFELSRNTLAILACYPGTETGRLEDALGAFEAMLQAENREGAAFRVSFFVGSRVPALSQCASSYYEASYLLETAQGNASRLVSIHVMDGRMDPLEYRLAQVLLLLQVDSKDACMREIRSLFQEAQAAYSTPEDSGRLSLTTVSLRLVNLAMNQIEAKPRLRAAFETPVSEWEALQRCRSEESLMNYLLHLYGRLYDLENPEEEHDIAAEGKSLPMNQVLAYVHSHYQDAMLSQAQIAEAFGVSPSTLSVQFKRAVGVNITTYIASIRVETVKQALEKTQQVLVDIAEGSGFNSVKTMIRIFKKVEGVTPGAYRRMIGGGAGEEEMPGNAF